MEKFNRRELLLAGAGGAAALSLPGLAMGAAVAPALSLPASPVWEGTETGRHTHTKPVIEEVWSDKATGRWEARHWKLGHGRIEGMTDDNIHAGDQIITAYVQDGELKEIIQRKIVECKPGWLYTASWPILTICTGATGEKSHHHYYYKVPLHAELRHNCLFTAKPGREYDSYTHHDPRSVGPTKSGGLDTRWWIGNALAYWEKLSDHARSLISMEASFVESRCFVHGRGLVDFATELQVGDTGISTTTIDCEVMSISTFQVTQGQFYWGENYGPLKVDSQPIFQRHARQPQDRPDQVRLSLAGFNPITVTQGDLNAAVNSHLINGLFAIHFHLSRESGVLQLGWEIASFKLDGGELDRRGSTV